MPTEEEKKELYHQLNATAVYLNEEADRLNKSLLLISQNNFSSAMIEEMRQRIFPGSRVRAEDLEDDGQDD